MHAGNPEQIGRYKIIERVGRGGMGVLFRGLDPVLDREVAIKLMLVDFSEDAEQMRPRFYREARAAARLQHPNIVTVFEFAEDGNTPYIVMEFLQGTSLQAKMAAPVPLTLDEKLHVIAQLCSALNYAHEQGVVHRDIKPANVFLLPDGTVKLLDFGIAKLATSTMTRQGDVLGSALYMSPEQVAGSATLDGRSDIFSTGVVLYELLAGRKPFQAETLTATVVKVLNEDPPSLDTVVPGLPAQLVAIVKKALAKDPAHRFATAGEMARELHWIRQALQASSPGMPVLEETQFATPTQILELQKSLETDRAKGGRSRASAAAPSSPKWLVPAGIGVVALVALVAGITMFSTRAPAAGEGGAATAIGETAGALDTAPAAPPPVETPATVSLHVDSVPSGATIAVNGEPTELVTPAAVPLSGTGPHRLRIAKAGFVAHEASLDEAALAKGSVSYTLSAVEVVTQAVSIDSAYPVEVFSGSRSIAKPSQSHRLQIQDGLTVRISAPQYLLETTLRVSGRPVTYQAPAVGYLTVLTRHETCNVKIGQRTLGFPPISRLPIASGQYRVDVVCPDGQAPPGVFVTVAPNETATARIF